MQLTGEVLLSNCYTSFKFHTFNRFTPRENYIKFPVHSMRLLRWTSATWLAFCRYYFRFIQCVYWESYIYLYNNNNDKGQPGAGGSFSINALNEPEIWLSLWASKMIQSGQTSVRTKSASARSPLRLLCKHVALLPQRRGGLLGTGTGREGGKRVKARPRTDPEDRGDRGPSPNNRWAS